MKRRGPRREATARWVAACRRLTPLVSLSMAAMWLGFGCVATRPALPDPLAGSRESPAVAAPSSQPEASPARDRVRPRSPTAVPPVSALAPGGENAAEPGGEGMPLTPQAPPDAVPSPPATREAPDPAVEHALAHAAEDWGIADVDCSAPDGAVLAGGAPIELAWRGADGAEVDVVLARLDGGEWTELDFEPGRGGLATALPEHTTEAVELAVVLVRGGLRRVIPISGSRSIDADPPATPATEPAFVTANDVELEVRPVDRGRSGVARLRLWYQAKLLDPWRPVREDEVGADFKAAFRYRLNLERDGVYAFRVTAVDHAGNAEPDPAPGDPPGHTIQLDRAAPVARLEATRATAAPTGTTVTWSAVDAWLDPVGASLFRSIDGGKWTLVAGGLPPNGTWSDQCEAASDPAMRYRIVVADRAGNMGAAEAMVR